VIALWEWTGEAKGPALTNWRSGLQRNEKARLDAKISLLSSSQSVETQPGVLVGPIKVKGRKFPHIYKMQVTTPVSALRPLLCKGPDNQNSEVTFLAGAREQDREFDPKNAPDTAVDRRSGLISKRDRRTKYESPPEGAAN
jgi:hypothetical protein